MLGLPGRIAITFVPGFPPIWTRLVRYYEKDFEQPTGLSPSKMVLDATCLFVAAAVLAVWWTAALFLHTF